MPVLVDRVEVAVIPILLGSGVPLVPLVPPGARVTLKLDGNRVYPGTGTVSLDYRVAYGD